jgi:sigma-B regulation protein RsbU (phosphoserine phosphatase)
VGAQHPPYVDQATSAEERRLAAVRRYEILDRPRDDAYQRIASLAATIFGTPIASVSIVDEDRVWFAACQGLTGMDEVHRDPGLCASVVTQDDVYVVNDALTDARTLEHPLVRGDLGLRFYAAAPIHTRDGYRLGTVDVIDQVPRETTAQQLQALRDLAALVANELELRLTAIQTVAAERRIRAEAVLAPQAADPGRCEVTRPQPCPAPAQEHIVDTAGATAWLCRTHAEQATITTSGIFLADQRQPSAIAAFLRGR